MKKIAALSTLALGVVACQHQAPPTQAVAPAVTAVAAPPVNGPATAPPAPVAIADSLTPAMRAMLRQVDLASLLLAPQPGKPGDYQSVLDGFFGTNPQRLSLAILAATRDSLRPSVYHVLVKTNYKKQIASFKGEIQFSKVADYYDQDILLVQQEDSFIQDTVTGKGNIINALAYSATAIFHFADNTTNACLLNGRVLLDFWLTDKGKIGTIYPTFAGLILDKAPTKGSGLLLQGTWRDVASGSSKPFLVSRDIFLLSPGIIQDFAIGDRGSEVNPKYAKLGWNEMWENDEWWADSPRPKLNL